MTKQFEPHPSFDVAGAVRLMTNSTSVMTANVAVGLAAATQVCGFWMTAAMKWVEALNARVGPVPGAEAGLAPRTLEKSVPVDAKIDDAEVVQMGAAARNVVPLRRARATAGRSRPLAQPRQATGAAVRAKAGAEPASEVASVVVSTRTDDFKVISGIGPKLEQVLKSEGISTYAHLASLSAGEVTSLEKKFGMEGRIARDEWQKQASLLAAKN